ncbi:hypothetical protein TomTYG75_01880 [Sphingobium sp. TomTYG75]
MVRLNTDPAAQDEAELSAWIEADPQHAIAYARAEAAWESAEVLKSATADNDLPTIALIASEPQRRLSRNIMIAAGVAVILFIIAAIFSVRTVDDADHQETRIGELRFRSA